MRHFLLIYTLAHDYLDRRPAFRAEQLALARAAATRGELLLGGAVTGPDAEAPEEAQLLFAGADAHAVEAFARADPYVANGLVIGWRVREWLTVVGQGAAIQCRDWPSIGQPVDFVGAVRGAAARRTVERVRSSAES